ncbi:hypothetical protein [Candidatus Hecatella orcuttiae]|nr:hypothetical protein [Candidatus Hecatella orcuttiae]
MEVKERPSPLLVFYLMLMIPVLLIILIYVWMLKLIPFLSSP